MCAFLAVACGESAPTAPTGQAAKDAGGIDAEFGVETFALAAPILKIADPPEGKYYYVDYTAATPASVKVTLTFTVQNYTLGAGVGQVLCSIDGKAPVSSTALTLANVDLSNKKGMHVISCTLANGTGQQDTGATSRYITHVFISQDQFSDDPKNKCVFGSECDDSLACSSDACVDLKCVYKIVLGCCANNSECATTNPTCLNPNTATSKCSSCTANADCDDGNVCTTNVCDLSGTVGVCTFPKPDPQCCQTADSECDDGQACTVDACNTTTKKCSHTKPAGVCCSDAECPAADICKVGVCIDLQCHYGKDSTKAGCCTANADCDDKNECTLNVCSATPGPNGYKTCSNPPDPAMGGVGVCCMTAGTTIECNDGNNCTADVCTNNKCVHTQVALCCAQDIDCDDAKFCTTNTCVKPAGSPTGLCTFTKTDPLCCDSLADCDDGLYCTIPTCSGLVAGSKPGSCTQTKTDPTCCDKDTDTVCNDNKFCTVDVCVNHICAHGPDITKPNCCEANSDCNDSNACTLDTCYTGASALPVTTGLAAHYDARVTASLVKDNLGNVSQWQDLSGNARHLNVNGNAPVYNATLINGLPGLNFDAAARRMTTAAFPNSTDVTVFAVIQWRTPDSWGCIAHHGNRDMDWSLEQNAAKGGNVTHFQSVNDNTGVELTLNTGSNYILMGRIAGSTRDYSSTTTGASLTAVTGTGNTISLGSKPLYVGASDVPEASKAYIGQILYFNRALSNTERDAVLDYLRQSWAIDNSKFPTPKTCQFVSNGVAGCCNSNTDCDDKNCATADYCDGFNKCKSTLAVDKCNTALDCDDQKVCTVDTCDLSGACGQCVHTTAPGSTCCQQDFECDDSKQMGSTPPNPKAACTLDKCDVKTNKCTNTPIATCCIDDADAVNACNDNNACTIEYCVNNQCRHTVPKGGCCATNADCNDGSKCTTDTCGNIVAGKGACTFTQVAGCLCDPLLTAQGLDCNDGNKCTSDACTGGKCTHSAITACCLDQFDCNDGSPCTADMCVLDECVHLEQVGSNKLCCSVATQAVDCAAWNSECAVGVCLDQADGSKKCGAQKLPVCTVNIGYCQDFQSGSDLPTMGWNPTDIGTGGKAAGNWKPATNTGLGPDQHAKLDWTPTVINYNTCLQSPIIQAAGASTITLQYDREFVPNGGTGTITILGSLAGASPDWQTATVIDSKASSAIIGPETVDVKLPPALSGSNGLRLAFCVKGATTFDITSYALDNICIVKGNKPSITNCPVNQVVGFSTTKVVPIKAMDADADAILSFQLVTAPEFVSISSALYYWLDNSWNSNLTVTPNKLSHIGTWPVTIKVSDGSLYSTCTFNVTVTYQGGYLVWRPSEVPKSQGDALYNALVAQGKTTQHITDLGLYPELSGSGGTFAGIFVPLGVYPANHVLTDGEAAALALYLSKGGKVYIEGGDTWVFDPQKPLHAMFKVQQIGDSSKLGFNGPLNGSGFYNDITQATPIVYDFGYDGSSAYNNVNDVITGKTDIARTKTVLVNTAPTEIYGVQVGHDDPSGYRTVASSVIFAGVKTGSSPTYTPGAMVGRLINFFDNGFIDCTTNAQCDDKDACTTDTCTAGACINKSICSCTPVGTLGCGQNQLLVSNGTGSTNSVTSYKCDPGVSYTGKEFAIKYTATQSSPVTVNVTGLTNAAAKIFVLKANVGSCDPAQCIAKGGAGSFSFAGAAGNDYFIVIDVPAGGSGQANVAISCAAPEICDNNIDDNGNNLVDCKDLASCCGAANCAEECDNVDNDCDGATDEGCDDDGDGYCDKDMVVSGTPTVCPKGGNDCNDLAGTVNPGAVEICNNGKDDNCDGVNNEDNASGCVNYWSDLDKDGYGAGASKCMCATSGAYTATKNGDCLDSNDKVNPAMLEICGDGLDNDCSGSQNDLNAQGCSDFYTDADSDSWGVLPKKCLCTPAGAVSATKLGDCDDSTAAIKPGQAEVCNGADDNCDNVIDEGCDDDKDGYCDYNLGYSAVNGTINVCNSVGEGGNLTLTCAAGYTITSVAFASYGTPSGTCPNLATSGCDAGSSVAIVKAACIGKNSCTIGANNTTFGDPCGGIVKTLAAKVVCTGAGTAPPICPKGAGDTDDLDPNINPAGKEICDGKDNNSDGKVDEGCDDDGDQFCDKTMIVIGVPAICPKGGGDCDDNKKLVNPGMAEDCNTADDDDCNGSTNDENATNCSILFSDQDGDGYGTKAFKCYCTPVGLFKAKKTADCDDTKSAINPGAIEVCDDIDNNCTGTVDEGCDDDGDKYCDSAQGVGGAGAKVCPNGGGDCNDANPNVNPGKAEVCGDGLDNNCNGSQNDAGAVGCTNFYADGDNDGFGGASSKCLCVAEGTFIISNNQDCDDTNSAINPTAVEVCDDKDNNCNAKTDEGCDDDGDKWCDAAMTTVGKPTNTCLNGGGDCNDTDGTINPAAVESCDNKDNNCKDGVDDGCDDDKDSYCDAAMTVSNPLPAVCVKGGADCNDLDSDVNPGAKEVCGNGIDDNCDGSQNTPNATNCVTYYFDQDTDGVGLAVSQCLCTASGGYTATATGDCDDQNKLVKPGQPELCSTTYDDNCNGITNEENATGCSTFYLDGDKDGYGLAGISKCFCAASGNYTGTQTGDCNDASAAVNPGKTEVCNDADDNCKLGVDEGCDDDSDKFCDSAMTTVGLPNICPNGGGDCLDTNANANPGKAEQCDGVDNNCNGQTDENCNKDGDLYCDSAMVTVGTPAICSKGGGDCNDSNNGVNPGVAENCATTYDDNCNGDVNDVGASGCTAYGVDNDADTYSDSTQPTKCMCKPISGYTGTKNGDCNDKNDLINPGVTEICDGLDNNCNSSTDESCDKDGDKYCDAAMVTVGKPAVCINGGGDCADSLANINPGAPEVCGNTVDENCNGSTNDINATGCTKYYLDADSDTYGVNVSQCWCAPSGNYKADGTKLGDCDDTTALVNPGVAEKCGDGIDNNCNGTQNDIGATGCVAFYQDGDKDGYGVAANGNQCRCFAEGAYITSNAGDCDDTNPNMSPAVAEMCDAFDNNCSGVTDEGCDDDGDKYCDSAMVTLGTPAICPNGGNDCNDTNAAVKPGVVETCDNIDNNCDKVIDDGCDDDKDGYCDKNLTLVGTSQPICTSGGGDCDDTNNQIRPGKAEVCDNFDNNCSGATDEGCDDDADKYCDSTMSVIGVPAVCTLGGGDCDDTKAAINPGAIEICDGLDNNCAAGIDEVCKDSDGDGYCVGSVAVSAACPKGGNDCNDSDKNVNPGATETCVTQVDDNCDGNNNPVGAAGCTNFYTDADADGFGTGAATCQCFQTAGKTALNATDCDDTKAAVNPGQIDNCDGLNNDCAGGVDDGCDGDGDGYCNAQKLITSTATCANTPKPGAGLTKPGDDCNDGNAAVAPGKAEICDNLDNNCQGAIDEGCDDDNDNYCDSGMAISGTPSTCTALGGDCNDFDANVKPGVTELCSTVYDDNCNGATNEQNATGCTTYYLDNDGDGWGQLTSQCWCAPSGNYKALKSGDCNDANAAVFPGTGAEACNNLDDNCNSVTDEGCDDDGDKYCDKAMAYTASTACPNGGNDCDDNSKTINPGAAEWCDAVDNNCNAQTDEACDADADLYCSSAKVVIGIPPVCPKGGGDCDDSTNSVSPGSPEICDSKDNNCNGLTDESGSQGCTTFYFDGDQDGFGVPSSSQCLCAKAGLYSSTNNTDCNDNCATCAPGKPELCDNMDNNCVGGVDEGCNADNDGYCNSAMVTVGNPPVCTKGGGDCWDTNASVNPGAFEKCNNADDNCNGIIDENASDSCAGYANSVGACIGGLCSIKCLTGFYNLNSSISDGCECNGSDIYEPNDTCASAYTVSTNLSDTGSGAGGTKETIVARLVDNPDVDWYQAYGYDTGDGGYAVCDRYNVRVVFLQNPNNNLRFDIYRGSCPAASGTNNQGVCCSRTDFNWFANFKGASGGENSRQWSEYGECPCSTGDNFDQSNWGWWNSGNPYCMNFNANGVCYPRGYYMTNCKDDTAWYYVKVYKVSGTPTCSSYTLEFSNGIYGQPGTGIGKQGY